MVDEQLRSRGIHDERVLKAIETVPRHLFVNKKEESLAYHDCPLPIGNGQTISQPYIVAFMTEVLTILPNHKVLEIGTGCGYQTAILSHLAKEVISIECISSLSNAAQKRLSDLDYSNITIHNSNGYLGWPNDAPYDRIICTAAPTSIPEKLIDQLTANGRMILPVGENIFDQSLYIVKKSSRGYISKERSLAVRFVPMVK